MYCNSFYRDHFPDIKTTKIYCFRKKKTYKMISSVKIDANTLKEVLVNQTKGYRKF